MNSVDSMANPSSDATLAINAITGANETHSELKANDVMYSVLM